MTSNGAGQNTDSNLAVQVAELRVEVRELRDAFDRLHGTVEDVLASDRQFQERCLGFLATVAQAVVNPSPRFLVLVGLVLLGGGLLTAADVAHLVPWPTDAPAEVTPTTPGAPMESPVDVATDDEWRDVP